MRKQKNQGVTVRKYWNGYSNLGSLALEPCDTAGYMESRGRGEPGSLRPWLTGWVYAVDIGATLVLQDQALTGQLPGVLAADACSQVLPGGAPSWEPSPQPMTG